MDNEDIYYKTAEVNLSDLRVLKVIQLIEGCLYRCDDLFKDCFCEAELDHPKYKRGDIVAIYKEAIVRDKCIQVN